MTANASYAMRVYASELLESVSYDGIWLDGTAGTHEFHVESPRLRAGDNAIEFGLYAISAIEARFSGYIGIIDSRHLPLNIWESTGTLVLNANKIIGPVSAVDAGEVGLIYALLDGFSATIRCPDIRTRIRQWGNARTRIVGARVDTRQFDGEESGTGASSVYLEGNGLVLEDCELITYDEETNSIDGVADTRLVVFGALLMNKAISSNVTMDYPTNIKEVTG